MAAAPPRRGARRHGRHTKGQRPVAPLVQALTRIHADLDRLGAPHALVGGLAVSARAEPRTTRDVDLAVGGVDEAQAERLVFALQQRGYRVGALVEQTRTKRLATARLLTRAAVVVDLLFASSGVEPELVARATPIELLPKLVLPVAALPDLLALKVLARDDRSRPQDADDLRALLAVSSASERAQVPGILELIQRRGFARGRRLLEHWRRATASFGRPARRAGFRTRRRPLKA